VGTPTGVEIQVDGVHVYHAPATGDKGKGAGLILLSDVFGWKLPNIRLIADGLAAEGFQVYVPDLFDGDHVPHGGWWWGARGASA
jgi:carboxymethylenebutenolidase